MKLSGVGGQDGFSPGLDFVSATTLLGRGGEDVINGAELLPGGTTEQLVVGDGENIEHCCFFFEAEHCQSIGHFLLQLVHRVPQFRDSSGNLANTQRHQVTEHGDAGRPRYFRLTVPAEVASRGKEEFNQWRQAHPAPSYDFSDQNLEGVDLSDVDLSGCKLTRCNLTRAKLVRTNLKEARLEESTFFNATLTGADLSGANLTGANLEEADLSGGYVVLSSFRERLAARNRGTFTVLARLERATLDGAILRDAKCRKARLRYANLRGTIIESASFNECDLRECDFRGARANSATSLNLSRVNGTRFNKFTLASMRDFGGLTQGELGTANIEDDVATLRASYSGFWQWIHMIALILFLCPYVAFVVEQWIKAHFMQVLPYRESITLWDAVVRYALTGESPVAGPWKVNWGQVGMFSYLLVYNVLRVVVLMRTKTLELREQVMGFPQPFHLRGGWSVAYHALKWGVIGNVCIVLVHTFHFLQQRVFLF
ncbi:MAG: pentapeptide repeat-containing protein [Planctomycetes bacterium]|nr:pentapeptide repeat-containing protein [Planctomycetota bacterium]MCK6531061.1 pentapeptide repeat-containing protein [Myxococcota bacterium]